MSVSNDGRQICDYLILSLEWGKKKHGETIWKCGQDRLSQAEV